MKIGIITSGTDMLTLFKFLAKYDHEYIIYYDQANRPYGERTFEEGLQAVQQGIDFLTKQKVDVIVVPPVFELASLDGKLKIENGKLLPLFQTYVLHECFRYSLVGKIGAIGDYADVGIIQKYLRMLEKTYKLSDTQKAIKKFHQPFAYRSKEVPLWKYFLTKLSFSHMMVNRVVKEDLKYFKDAMVDTLIPVNYGYFNYQQTISKFLNFKKIRFHKLEKIEAIFASLKLKMEKKYGVKIFYTGHVDVLQEDNRMMRMLERGKGVEVEWKEV